MGINIAPVIPYASRRLELLNALARCWALSRFGNVNLRVRDLNKVVSTTVLYPDVPSGVG